MDHPLVDEDLDLFLDAATPRLVRQALHDARCRSSAGSSDALGSSARCSGAEKKGFGARREPEGLSVDGDGAEPEVLDVRESEPSGGEPSGV